MFGQNLQLILRECRMCHKWVAIRLDLDDLARHECEGVFVQDAFVDSSGRPYLSSADREMVLSAVCNDCWTLLCPDPNTHPTHYQ